MPQRSDIPPVETEKGFGTGLRAQLSRRRGGADDSPEHELALAAAEAGADDDAEEAVPPDPETLAAELTGALERERALKTALAEQTDAYEKALDELEERERQAIASIRAAEEKSRELDEERASLATERPSEAESARAYLRRRVEASGERVWNAFEAALEATRSDGTPDFRTRLAAATALLAEAYAPTDGTSALQIEGEPERDDLAALRAAKALKPLP